MKKFFKIIGVIIGVFIVIGIIGAIAGGNSSSSTQSSAPQSATTQTTTTKPTAPAPKPLSMDDELANMLKAAPAPTDVKTDFDRTITYTLTNNTKDKFDYVEMDVQFFDKSGVKIDDAMVNTTNVAPGQKFQLKVTTMETSAVTYKVVGIYSSALHN